MTDDTGPDIATPATPDAGPDGSTSPDSATDTRSAEAPDAAVSDARDGAATETPALVPDVPLETADATDGDTTDTPGAGGCVADLSGASPFGKALSGTASFSPTYGTAAAITSTVTAYIYFPAGRVAGAPVQLGMQSRVVTTQYFFGPPVALASDLSAAGLTVGGHDLQITGNLLPGAGGLQATIGANFSSPGTDVADDRTATMQMCPVGDVPAPAVQVTESTFSPLSKFGFYSTTPISSEGLGALRITSPLGAVTIKVSSELNSRFSAGPNFTVVAASSSFPPGQPLTFDASGVKDVLGRNVPLSLSTTQVLATTAVLNDLSFAIAPPAGATACSGCSASMFPGLDGGAMLRCTGGGTVASGILRIGTGQYGDRSVDALLALPSTNSTRLRVRMAVGDVVEAGSSCRNGFSAANMADGIMAVVGPNGEASAPVSLTCDGAMVDHVIDLPSASPLWLVVHVEGYTPMPFFTPVPGPPSISIDELQLM